MRLFVPFKLKEEPNSFTASIPFDPDFEVKLPLEGKPRI